MNLNAEGSLKLRLEQELLCTGRAWIALFAWEEANARQLKRHKTVGQRGCVWKKVLHY